MALVGWWAQAFARLGSRVPLIEAADRLLPREEPEASAVISTALTREGVTVRVGSPATLVERSPDGSICVHTETGESIAATHLWRQSSCAVGARVRPRRDRRRGAGHLAGGRLVGATVVALTGGELIHEAALAMQTNMFVGRLAQTTHAYPTWSMAIQQAALQFFGESGGLRARPVGAAPPSTAQRSRQRR